MLISFCFILRLTSPFIFKPNRAIDKIPTLLLNLFLERKLQRFHWNTYIQDKSEYRVFIRRIVI